MSLRTRIAALVALTVALLLVALGVALQVQSARTLVAAVDDDLRAIARSLERDPRGVLVLTAPGRDRFGGAAGIVQVVGADGVIVLDRRQRPALGPGAAREQGAAVLLPVDEGVLAVARGDSFGLLRTVTVEGVPLRMLVTPIGERLALQVARPIDEVEEVVAALRVRTAVTTLVGALLAALLAWVVAGRSIRPVTRLTQAVESVRDGADLSRRVTVPDGDDEVARLAAAFDAMLARLEASRLAQDRLAADASHELRTPLTSLRTNVEVLAQGAERLTPDDRARLTEDVIAQLDELTSMVDGLVTLTRVGTDADTEAPTDLHRLVADVVDAAHRRYPGRADDLTLADRATSGRVIGDARELSLAVSALVDNAVKYAPEGPIHVELADGAGPAPTVRVTVRDHGPGVTPDVLPHLFERFYRAPEARSMPGAGLGLALVERVARAHGGSVTATLPPAGGLSVVLELPADRDAR